MPCCLPDCNGKDVPVSARLSVPSAVFLLRSTWAAPGPNETRHGTCHRARRFTDLYEQPPSDILLETGLPAKGAIPSPCSGEEGSSRAQNSGGTRTAEFIPTVDMRTWSLDEAESRTPRLSSPPGFLSALRGGLFRYFNYPPSP